MSQKGKKEEKEKDSLPTGIRIQGNTALQTSVGDLVEWICLLGATVRIHLNRWKRSSIYHLENLFGSFFHGIAKIFKNIIQGFANTKNDLVDSVKKANYKYRRNKSRVLARPNENKALSKIEIGAYGVQEYSVVAGKVSVKVLNYILPIIAVLFFVIVVQFWSSLNYGVEVSLKTSTGEVISLGYIKDESLYESAEKIMQERIYYQNTDDILYTTPTFRLAVVDNDSLLTADQLSDEIIRATNSEISEGYGLYVDNQFLGATVDEDHDALVGTINGILDQYRTGEADEKLNFAQDVELRKGLYLNSSIKPIDGMISMVTQNQQESATYEIQSGDTISGIASKLDIPSADIYAMNPGIETATMHPGDKLLIQVEKPFLDVTKTVTEQYEGEIAYESIVKEDSSIYRGNSKKQQTGTNGAAVFTDEVVYQNGMEVSRETINRQVTVEPVNEIIVRGTKDYPTVNTSGAGTTKADGTAVGSGNFINPVASGGHVTCEYLGYRGHTGIDIQSFAGDKILAADKGQVIKVEYGRSGYGYHVIIDHGNGMQTLYAHNSAIYVSQGDYVTQGQVIAAQGRTGNVTGVHCHFEVRVNGSPVNPRPYLPI